MYDGLRLLGHSLETSLHLLQRLLGWKEVTDCDTGEVRFRSTWDGPFFCKVYEKSSCPFIIRGSLHRFFDTDGRNDTLFTFANVCEAVRDFCIRYGVNPYAPILTRLEIGLNIPTKCPEAVIDSAILFHGKTCTNSHNSSFFYGKYWQFDDYEIKLYKKGKELVRFEIQVKRLRYLRGIHIASLADLMNRDTFIRCLHFLYSHVDEFLFVPGNYNTIRDNELVQYLKQYRNDLEWKGLDKRKRFRLRKEVEARISSSVDTIKWKQVLRRRILELGAAILEVSVNQLVATFSILGLTLEKVAGAVGECDLKTEIDTERIIELEDTNIIPSNKTCQDYSIDIIDIIRLWKESHITSTMSIFKEVIYIDCSRLLEMFQGVLMYVGFRIGGRGPPKARFRVYPWLSSTLFI